MKLLIQACGKWTRLWPLSKEKKPKQFIEINWEAFIKKTKNRFLKFLKSEKDVFYSILKNQEENLIESIWNVEKKQIIFWSEKAKENSPNILIAIYKMLKSWIDENEDIIMTWSDLYFDNEEKLTKQLKYGIDYIKENPEKILLTGIKPTESSDSFWYIECWNKLAKKVFEIESFKEKPNKEKAEEYFKKWNFLWNWWIFIFKLWFFWKESERLNPEFCKLIKEVIDNEKDYLELDSNNFDKPIDKLVFEKSKNLACIKIENSWWNDVWNFESLHSLSKKDESLNCIIKWKNQVIAKNSHWNFIQAKWKNIILNWVNELVVIEDWENLVILNKKDSKWLKELTKNLPESILN